MNKLSELFQYFSIAKNMGIVLLILRISIFYISDRENRRGHVFWLGRADEVPKTANSVAHFCLDFCQTKSFLFAKRI